jgi:hypothetical protein
VQIDHGGGQSLVAHEHLYSSDIVAGLQKVGGKGVAQGMDAVTFLDSGLFSSVFVDLADGLVT